MSGMKLTSMEIRRKVDDAVFSDGRTVAKAASKPVLKLTLCGFVAPYIDEARALCIDGKWFIEADDHLSRTLDEEWERGAR